jgi:Domain of unknown function (DUF1918)
MEATVGDRLHIHGHNVGDPGRTGEIVEVRGSAGEPPYLVRFDDGHTRLVFPGPDAVVERPARAGGARKAAAAPKAAARGRGGAGAKSAGAKSAGAKGAARKKSGK